MLSGVAQLPGYEFEGFLGRGAMGAVYLARQTSVDRLVAIKQIELSTDVAEEARLRFLREAQTLARLRHPNIISIYDLVEQDGGLYMVTEYVEGISLQEILEKVGVTAPAGLRVIADVAAALEAARRQEVVHRDLKPGNVFVTSTGICKLGDFGLARLVEGEQTYATQVATVLGTPAYMSPEQAEGEGGVDHRADLYSLAVMSYQLLVGRLPFDLGTDVLATLEAHVSAPVPRPTRVVTGFSKDVEKVLLQGLEKQPARRQQSALAFWEKLEPAADRAWPGWRQQSDLAALVRQAGAGQQPGGVGVESPMGTMVARVTGVYETLLEPSEAPVLATTVSPLDTTIAPASPLGTMAQPLIEQPSPLGTMVQAVPEQVQLETTLAAVTGVKRPRRSRPGGARVLLLAALVVVALALIAVVATHH